MKTIKAEPFIIGEMTPTKVKLTGSIVKVSLSMHRQMCHILRLSKDNYLDLRTGEVKEYNHKNRTRADNTKNVRKSFSNLRDIINTNVIVPENCRFVTLTYKENVTDKVQAYEDFRKFIQRFRRHCNKQGYPHFEYICVYEPQGRGAWHMHVIFIFDGIAPFIENKEVADVWKLGYTKTTALRGDVDNLGLYYTAYLCDVEITEIEDARLLKDLKARATKEVTVVNENGAQEKKRYVKGLRLKMYSKGAKVYSCSRGIKKPTEFKTNMKHANEIVKDAEKTYENTVSIVDDNGNEVNRVTNMYYRFKSNYSQKHNKRSRKYKGKGNKVSKQYRGNNKIDRKYRGKGKNKVNRKYKGKGNKVNRVVRNNKPRLKQM